jgi:hypothetical protein
METFVTAGFAVAVRLEKSIDSIRSVQLNRLKEITYQDLLHLDERKPVCCTKLICY